MSAVAPRTSGELREFLSEVLASVRNGTIGPSRASAISKVASQINDSFATETQTALVALKLGMKAPEIGEMLLVPASQEPRQIEQKPAPTAVAPIEAAPRPDRVWCDQCDRSVTAIEGDACVSAFCKAKA